MDILYAALAWVKWIVGWLGWFGIGAVPIAIAVAIIWFFPRIRTVAAMVAVGWALAFGSYTLGDINGAARIKAEWKAAEQRAIEKGRNARERAEQDIPAVAPDPGPRNRDNPPKWVRDDPDNRDNH
jgi:hypothetical protein